MSPTIFVLSCLVLPGGIEPPHPALQTGALPFELQERIYPVPLRPAPLVIL